MTPFPSTPLTIHGGCACSAFRYKINIPPHSSRPPNPYWSNAPPTSSKRDTRLPMVAFCHCNDCRRATGALVPALIAADLGWVAVSVGRKGVAQTAQDGGEEWVTGEELLGWEDEVFEELHLSFYRSSAGRRRWFCGRCGTHLGYNVEEGGVPAEWGWPRMLDFWLGTVDREDLELEWMRPDTRVWCDWGVGWIKGLVVGGAGDIPEPAGFSSLVGEKK